MPEATLRHAYNLSEDWMVVIFLFSLVGLAYNRRVHPARILRLWKGMWNVRSMRQTMREDPNTPRSNLLFNATYYANASLIAFAAVKLFRPQLSMNGILLYALLLGLLLGIYLLKQLTIYAVSLLSDGDFSLDEYGYHVFLTNRLLGLLLFPLAALIVYFPTQQAEYLLLAGLAIVATFIAYRIIRSLITALESGVTPFYILFYICTLEILPTALGIKWLISN
jgi:hypothetical protein